MERNIRLGVRKIRAVNCSHIIALPKVWLINLGVKIGDEIAIEMQDDRSLVLRPLNGEDNHEKEVQ